MHSLSIVHALKLIPASAALQRIFLKEGSMERKHVENNILIYLPVAFLSGTLDRVNSIRSESLDPGFYFHPGHTLFSFLISSLKKSFKPA